MKQLEKQQKKLAAKGIHVDMDALKKDYDHQKAGGKSSLQFDAQKMDEEIDVVGLDRSEDELREDDLPMFQQQQNSFNHHVSSLINKKKVSPFSIESLLNSRVAEEEEKLRRRKMDLEDEDEDEDMFEDSPNSNNNKSRCHSPADSFQPERTSSPNPDKNWHQPQQTETETDEDHPKDEDEDHPIKPLIHKPSPTFPPLLLGPRAPFNLIAAMVANSQHHHQQQQQYQNLPNFLNTSSSSPPSASQSNNNPLLKEDKSPSPPPTSQLSPPPPVSTVSQIDRIANLLKASPPSPPDTS